MLSFLTVSFRRNGKIVPWRTTILQCRTQVCRVASHVSVRARDLVACCVRSEAAGAQRRHPNPIETDRKLCKCAEGYKSVDQKYKELQEYREKLAKEGLEVKQTYDPKVTHDVRDTRVANADVDGMIAERIISS